ncbi:Aim9p [Fusarium albosuccineum]|uniref:Aim9p n=1 Tax=Fusarium albosuccineum TaxID=1237068 RepID=A0A8H4P6Z6_9HYPO|nr:Aim9p [Fusarium albosuccineum]
MSSYSSADDEYDSDEPPELVLDLDKLKDRATETMHAACISVKRLTRGSRHEIFALKFEETDATPHESLIRAKYSCIARFARVKGTVAKEESEIATIRYLKQHTSIPVPEIYYEDLDPVNEVGAAFVLMERLPGRHLYKIWDDLSLDNKKAALSEIASVMVQFASLRFDQIGCLTQGGIGPIVSPCYEVPKGPFDSTLAYLESFVSTDLAESPELAELFQQIRTELAMFTCQDNLVYLEPPFVLVHADFDAQNMLFVEPSDGSGLKLTGLIDFEFAHTGPVYHLYEYPIFIQDVSWSKHLYAENATLRAHFVSQIFNSLPDSDAQKSFITAINSKCFLLNSFQDTFMSMKCSEDTLIQSATYYLKSLKDGTGLAYSGRLDYKPELYSDLGKPIDSETPVTADETLAEGSGDEA